MEFNAKQQSEFALFLQIQANLRVFPAVSSLPSSSFSRSLSRIPAHSLSIPAGISQSSEFASKTSKTDVSPGFWLISGIPKGGSARRWSPRRRSSWSVPAIPTFPYRCSTMPFFPSDFRNISGMRVISAVFAEL